MRHGELCTCPQCRPMLYPDRKPARHVLTLGSRMRTVPLLSPDDPEAARERWHSDALYEATRPPGIADVPPEEQSADNDESSPYDPAKHVSLEEWAGEDGLKRLAEEIEKRSR